MELNREELEQNFGEVEMQAEGGEGDLGGSARETGLSWEASHENHREFQNDT